MKKGLLIIVTGPSGVGKDTIREKLFKMEELNLEYSISMTTRRIRPGEVDGQDYFFVSKERFDEAIKNDELLESATFVNNSYGTPRKYVEDLREKGKNVLLEIEVQGARQVMKKVPDSISIFLLPPSIEELENRLIHRGTESVEVINQRINKAKEEISCANEFKYNVVNDDVTIATNKIRNIILDNYK